MWFFFLAVEQWTSSTPSAGSWRVHGSSPNMCFVDLEKAFDRVPQGVLYGVPDPLIRAVRSLYDRCQSLVRIAGSKSDVFPVSVGLHQGCLLSPILFIIFMGLERSQMRWLGHLVRMPPGRLPGEVFRARPTGRRPQGRPRTRLCLSVGLGTPQGSPGRAGGSWSGTGTSGFLCSSCCPSDPIPREAIDDGWMDEWMGLHL